MNDILSMFRQTLEMEAKALNTPDHTTINRALELCANAYQLGVEESDWESLRHQYAGMAMQGILANVDFVHTSIKVGEDLGICCQTVAARNAVSYADALIKELKGIDT